MQVIPALGSGGVEVGTIEIGNAIVAAGGRALIAANFQDQDLVSSLSFINLPLNTKNPFQMARNALLLKDLIQKENVDILHVRSRAPAWSAYRAARALGIPFITTYHAAYHSHSALKTIYNSVMARGDQVIAISHFIKEHIIKTYKGYSWFDPTKICLIPRGIDLHYFNPDLISEERLSHLRQKWGIPSHMRLVLLPGRISRSKGHNVLIRAFSLMKHANAMAVFVGSAQKHEAYRDELLTEISAMDLRGRMKWVPPCPDLPAAYKLADIIVCPSLVPEGFGRIMAEAQAMKKPIVASSLGAASEVIESGKTGWLIPPDNAEILAHTLDTILDMPQSELDAIGNRGREYVQSYFSKELMTSQTIDVYKKFLRE